MAAGPAGIHYDNSPPTDTGYGGNCLMICNAFASRAQATRVQALRAAGVECLEYALPVHDYPGSNTGTPEWRSFYNGLSGTTYARADTPTAWFWDPSNPGRVVVGAYSGWVMDMRAGSAWSDHLLDWFEARMASASWGMDGWFLDVFGDDYLGMIAGLTTPEQVAYRAGVVDFARRLRTRLGDEVILQANNTWQTGVPLNGVCIENHSTPGSYYTAQFNRHTPPLSRRRNSTINSTVPLTQTWAADPGVDHACYSGGDYGVAQSPPFGTIAAGMWPAGANHITLWDSTTGGGEPGPDPDPVAPAAVIALAISEPVPGQIRITFQMPVGVTGYRSRFKYGLGQTFASPEDGFEFRSASAEGAENVETAALGFTADTPVTVGVWARNGDLLSPVTARDITTGPQPHSGVRVTRARAVAPSRRIVRI